VVLHAVPVFSSPVFSMARCARDEKRRDVTQRNASVDCDGWRSVGRRRRTLALCLAWSSVHARDARCRRILFHNVVVANSLFTGDGRFARKRCDSIRCDQLVKPVIWQWLYTSFVSLCELVCVITLLCTEKICFESSAKVKRELTTELRCDVIWYDKIYMSHVHPKADG